MVDQCMLNDDNNSLYLSSTLFQVPCAHRLTEIRTHFFFIMGHRVIISPTFIKPVDSRAPYSYYNVSQRNYLEDVPTRYAHFLPSEESESTNLIPLQSGLRPTTSLRLLRVSCGSRLPNQ